MRLIKELPTKKIFVEFAIRCAERCLNNFEKWNKEDKRPREAMLGLLIAAKNYLNNPCKKTQVAAESARSAAWSAAESAAESAWSAAESAAWSAAESAWSAVESARSAVESAVESAAGSAAEKKWQERILNKIFKRYERND